LEANCLTNAFVFNAMVVLGCTLLQLCRPDAYKHTHTDLRIGKDSKKI
jgi:hypothetical protein